MTVRGQPNRRVYENVQKIVDKIIDQVEDRMLGLIEQGIQTQTVIRWSNLDSCRMKCEGIIIMLLISFYRTCDG